MPQKVERRFVTICKTELLRKRGVTEVAYETRLAHFAIPLQGDESQIASERVRIIGALSEAGVKPLLVKFHPQALHFTIRSEEKEMVIRVLERMNLKQRARQTDNCCLVAVVSSAMRDLPGVMSRIAEVALRLSTNVLETSDTRAAVLLLVREAEMKPFIKALCEAFGIKSARQLR